MKKKNMFKEVALKGISKSLERNVKREVKDWPPPCLFYAHQPKRPESKI